MASEHRIVEGEPPSSAGNPSPWPRWLRPVPTLDSRRHHALADGYDFAADGRPSRPHGTCRSWSTGCAKIAVVAGRAGLTARRRLLVRLAFTALAIVVAASLLWARQTPRSLLRVDGFGAALTEVAFWSAPTIVIYAVLARTAAAPMLGEPRLW